MRKTILFLIGLIIAGTASFYGGYYLYMTNRPEISYEMPMTLQKGIIQNDKNAVAEEQVYYLARIENEKLMIYEMPDERIYDSLKIGTLQFMEKDYEKLLDGITFYNLTEVFEFLENCMS